MTRVLLKVHRVQLDRVRTRIADAAGGRGGVIVLVGEPGVGKTTLAERAADLATEAGLYFSLEPMPGPWLRSRVLALGTVAQAGAAGGAKVEEGRRHLEGEGVPPGDGGDVAKLPRLRRRRRGAG